MYNDKYHNKIVVITGAASGIGAEFVRFYAKHNAKIILLDMHMEGMQKLIQSIDLKKDRYLLFTIDITQEDKVKEVFQVAVGKFQKIDILINNAGISQMSLFENTNLSIFKKVMDVNFYGSVYCTKYALPYLKKSKGQIITLSSVAGFSPLYGRTAYAASKHALHGFFNSLQAEVRDDGISVLLACPSFVKTNIEKRTFNEEGKPFGEKKGTPGELMLPSYVVSQIIKAIESNKNIVYISKISKVSKLISFFFPRIFEKKMVEKVKADF